MTAPTIAGQLAEPSLKDVYDLAVKIEGKLEVPARLAQEGSKLWPPSPSSSAAAASRPLAAAREQAAQRQAEAARNVSPRATSHGHAKPGNPNAAPPVCEACGRALPPVPVVFRAAEPMAM